MLYHVAAQPGSSLSVAEVKALVAFLADRDASRPPKSKQIEWLKAMNDDIQNSGLLPPECRISSRSSAPMDHPSIMVSVNGFVTILEITDGDVRIADLPFDFLDNVWFRFRAGPVEINGLTDEDWILARLSDTRGIIVKVGVCS